MSGSCDSLSIIERERLVVRNDGNGEQTWFKEWCIMKVTKWPFKDKERFTQVSLRTDRMDILKL